MRRKDREVTDITEILAIIGRCDVCRLGLIDGEHPYIVPLNFGSSYEGGVLTLCFHGAKEGRKLDIIAHNASAGFEMDCSHRLVSGDAACEYGMEYESVIGFGTVEMCSEHDEKRDALRQLMRNYAPGREFSFTDSELDGVAVFKLVADTFTAKRCVKKS
jgi:nitroimidazol reductase NimA-like FMN-containing flavoprotein (pyridoxamine 5'-phosphate oxidase superfamily)